MRINQVVINASPLICLFKSELVFLLPKLFQEIVIPEAVLREITAGSVTDVAAKKVGFQDWLRPVKQIKIDPLVASWGLGKGESSVLSFALKHPQYWALVDDKEARRCALSLSCRYTGTVGVIVLAKRRGVIPTVREPLEKLQTSGLWLAQDWVEELCKREGEG